jgi:hypothetical protein
MRWEIGARIWATDEFRQWTNCERKKSYSDWECVEMLGGVLPGEAGQPADMNIDWEASIVLK